MEGKNKKEKDKSNIICYNGDNSMKIIDVYKEAHRKRTLTRKYIWRYNKRKIFRNKLSSL